MAADAAVGSWVPPPMAAAHAMCRKQVYHVHRRVLPARPSKRGHPAKGGLGVATAEATAPEQAAAGVMVQEG